MKAIKQKQYLPKEPNELVIGILGNLTEDYSQKETEFCNMILSHSLKDIPSEKELVICSRLINKGASKVAYNWANSVSKCKTRGIAASKCWEHPIRMVDDVRVVNGEWGVEINKFVAACDGFIMFNLTKELTTLVEEIVKSKKKFMDFSASFAQFQNS